MAESDAPRVADFFVGRHVLVTGATGFLGGVLLEKLLRACPALGTVYVLVRARRGRDAPSRLAHLLQTPLFDRLKAERGAAILHKVVGVAGDVALPELGLNAADRHLLCEQVSVVFHAAATTNFNAALDAAVRTNLLGTRSVMQLCQQMKHIVALVYVSTAYCNCTVRDVITEQVYPSTWSPEQVLQAVREEGKAATRLLGGHPNTYSFTKQLAENVLRAERGNLPVAIVRPSVVLGTWEEPVPGWVDNVQNGAFAFIAGAGKGVFRVSMADPEATADVIPCDLVANLLIAAAWSVAVDKEAGLQVFHSTSGRRNLLTWGEYTRLVVEGVRAYPCREVLWYPAAKCRVHPWRVFLATLLLQLLPAMAMSTLGAKSSALLGVQRRYWRGIEYVRYFTTRHWYFDTTCTTRLAQRLAPPDRATFPFDVAAVHWPTCLERNVLGIRKYYHKESPDTLPAARTNMAIWRCVHVAAYICLLLCLVALLAPLLGLALSLAIAAGTTLLFAWL